MRRAADRRFSSKSTPCQAPRAAGNDDLRRLFRRPTAPRKGVFPLPFPRRDGGGGSCNARRPATISLPRPCSDPRPKRRTTAKEVAMASNAITPPCLIVRVECAVISRVRSETSCQTIGTSANGLQAKHRPYSGAEASGGRVMAEGIRPQGTSAACVPLSAQHALAATRAPACRLLDCARHGLPRTLPSRCVLAGRPGRGA